jgi:Zn-dependent M28 family amino/carboxypeptidase
MNKIQKGFKANEALVLRYGNERSTHILDSFEKYQTQPGFVVFTEEKKITHTIAREVNKIASITIFDSLIQNKESLLIELKNEFVDVFKCKNIMGMVKGKSKDSFIVYTAHYDHLGMQAEAMFPGASDNASGVSMILSLAKYYAKNKPNYDTYFLLFSGEEAGLLGSHYFVDYPTFSLSRIKFLMNIDIMGNAENGIMIVNGEANKQKYDLMSSINNQKKYVPEVKIRGKAANSDHYFFSEKGVPAIFIYSLGGQGYYHDVQDRAENLLYTNYENVFRLIRDFTDQL